MDPIVEQSKTSIDYIVGLSFVGLFILVAALLVYIGSRWVAGKSDEFDEPEGKVFIGVGIAVALITVGIFVATAWPPFNMEYHSYRLVDGQVAEVQSRFLGGDGGTTQNFAVMLAGSDAIYRCDDTRCSLVKQGDHIWMWCIREWQQASTPGYTCNYDRVQRGGAS